jgi:hypothetical protein
MTDKEDESGKIHHSIGVYFVSKTLCWSEVGEFSDFFFSIKKTLMHLSKR